MHARIRRGRRIEMFFATAGDDDLVAELVQSFCEAATNTRASASDEDSVFGEFDRSLLNLRLMDQSSVQAAK